MAVGRSVRPRHGVGHTHALRVRHTGNPSGSPSLPCSPCSPLLAAAPAAAQTVTTLVSNTGQGATASVFLSQTSAQGFSTGSNAAGYTLSSVDIVSSDDDSFAVALYTTDTSGLPDTESVSLTPPGSFAAGTLTFTAPADTTLSASTDYSLVITLGTGVLALDLHTTSSDSEDSGGATGWSLANNHRTLSGNTWSASSTGRTFRIAIKGYANTVTANNAPVFNPTAVSRSVAENTAADENVGAAVTATDADTGDTLTYSLGGADAASFDIVSTSGQVQTKTGVTYDHEAKASYAVTVTASDGTDTADATVTISVTDVNEPPTAPAAPAVTATTGSTTSLTVSWTAPTNTGKPAIDNYDLQYRQGNSGNFTAGPQDQTGLTASIGSLTAGTSYQVQVRAHNDEGDGDWSASGTGSTNSPTNNAPVFADTALTRSVAENTAANTNIGAVIPAATDADTGDTLTYSMEGGDAASFAFTASTRRIKTKTGVALDHESKSSYSVTIKVEDGNGGSDTVAVTISVTDVDEPPTAPGAPTVAAVSGSTTSLDVTWTAPTNTGKPAIDSYDIRYRQGTSGNFTNGPQGATGTSGTITGLTADTLYQVQVRATNDEGDSGWSASGSATTNAANNPPVFNPDTVSRSVAENTAADENVGAPVTATDADTGDTLTYTLDLAGAASFDIVSSSGQIKTKTGVTYDHEATDSYAVTVTASDGTDSATATVTISVTDVDEPPAAPAAPTVSSTSTTSLEVSWMAPTNTGKPAIDNYDLQYRQGTSGNFTNGPQNVTGTSATITGLTANTPYQVQVRAHNAEGDGDWSASGSGRTNVAGNNAPVFGPSAVSRSVAENTAANTNIGAVIPAATDADTGDTLTYSMEGGDAASFAFTASTRRIKTKTGVALDHESKASYSVMIKVEDGNGGSDTVAVTINVTDVAEPPTAPAAPTVGAVSGSTTRLTVSWAAPPNTGKPDIDHYDIRYRISGNFANGPQNVNGTTATITGLTEDTLYQVQVRATNAEGDSGWSASGFGRTNVAGNNAPVFNPATVSRSLAENPAAGQNVGAPVTATDADTGDTLTYTLGGADFASFDIVETSGQIRTKSGVTYGGVGASYSVTVTASDGTVSATATVTITVRSARRTPPTPPPPPPPPLMIEETLDVGTTTWQAGDHRVTVQREAGTPAVRLALVGPVTEDVTITVAPATPDVPLETGTFGLGPAEARTVVDVTVDPVPAGGLRLCLPVTAALLQAAGDEPLVLLHYVNGRWTEVPGAALEPAEARVCATVTEFSPFAVGYQDVAPTFDVTLAPLALTAGQAIEPVVLPAATGGNGVLVYRLTSDPAGLAGLTFDAATRTLSGTPTAGGRYVFTYRADRDAYRADRDAAILTFRVTVTTVMNQLHRAWLSRFGRTVATHVTDAVGERLRTSPGQASHVTVGGYRLPLGRHATGGADDPETATTTETTTDRLAALLTGLVGRALGLGPAPPQGGGPGTDPWAEQPAADPRLGQSQILQLPTVRLRDVLLGSSFRLALGDDDASPGHMRLTAWGRVAGTQFDGRDGALTLDGNVLTGTVGVDSEWDRLLAGVAVSHSLGDGSFTGDGAGDLDSSTLTSIHPYLRYAVNERVDVWSVLGYGWGDMTLEPGTGGTLETDMTLMMGSFGGRGLLLSATDNAGFQLAARTDAMFTRTTSGAVAGLAETEADAHRVRLVLEGSRPVLWPEGQSVTPTVELGVRHDWGDAETGFGLELGGRVRYADPGHGLTIEAAVRGLLAHEDNDYKEWGASGSLRFAPGSAGQGLALTLSPTWGAASSGVESLWMRQTAAGLAQTGTGTPAGRLNAEVAYGFAAFDTGLLTPYAGAVLSDGAARTYRLGTRLRLTGRGTSGLALTLEGQRTEPTGQQPLNQGLQLQATWGF